MNEISLGSNIQVVNVATHKNTSRPYWLSDFISFNRVVDIKPENNIGCHDNNFHININIFDEICIISLWYCKSNIKSYTKFRYV